MPARTPAPGGAVRLDPTRGDGVEAGASGDLEPAAGDLDRRGGRDRFSRPELAVVVLSLAPSGAVGVDAAGVEGPGRELGPVARQLRRCRPAVPREHVRRPVAPAPAGVVGPDPARARPCGADGGPVVAEDPDRAGHRGALAGPAGAVAQLPELVAAPAPCPPSLPSAQLWRQPPAASTIVTTVRVRAGVVTDSWRRSRGSPPAPGRGSRARRRGWERSWRNGSHRGARSASSPAPPTIRSGRSAASPCAPAGAALPR